MLAEAKMKMEMEVLQVVMVSLTHSDLAISRSKSGISIRCLEEGQQ